MEGLDIAVPIWTESRERTGAPDDLDRRHLTTKYSARIHVP